MGDKKKDIELGVQKTICDVKRVSRTKVYEGRVVTVYRDHMDVSGHEADWDFIHHDGAAAVVAVDDDGKILMVRQYRNALDRYTIELPAGKVDSIDESRRTCAFRELREETGYTVDSEDMLEHLITVDTTVALCDEEIEIYLARNLKKVVQDLDDDERIDVLRYDVDELLDMIYRHEIKDSKTVAGIYAYALKYKEKSA